MLGLLSLSEFFLSSECTFVLTFLFVWATAEWSALVRSHGKQLDVKGDTVLTWLTDHGNECRPGRWWLV